MNSHFVDATSFKLGLKPHLQDPPSNILQPLLHKLSPLPIYRKKLLNPSKTRECLRSKGYKFFAKLPAAGPSTLEILKDIRNSHCIKWIQYFEFDHYLCDSSHLHDLRRVCHKIKGIKRLNLVIRRVDNKVELETLSPFLARFTRLTSLRLEFPNTQNVTDNALDKLSSAFGNCTFLKSIEHVNVNMPDRCKNEGKKSAKSTPKHKYLEQIKLYMSLRKGAIKNDFDQEEPEKEAKLWKLKSLDITIFSTGEWAKKGVDQDLSSQMAAQALDNLPSLQRLKIKEIKTSSNYEDSLNFFTSLSVLSHLSHLEIELLKCQITDLDIIACAQGLTKLNQLKYFSLKILHNSNITEECIEKVSGAISRLENLSSFDLYFRKISLSSRGLVELGKRIQNSSSLNYCCTKESIHIYKKGQIEVTE